ncbi:hypothetical protein EWH99_07095 [Sporolactobacillus sp. THM7-7]|nr:hypothetical protein EWH99_07095 [Sporolactobacillus sp. THM7-7]
MLGKRWIFIGILALAGLFIFVLIGQQISAPERVVKQFESAVRDNQPKQLLNILVSGDPDRKVDVHAAKAMIADYRSDRKAWKKAADGLREQIADRSSDSSNVSVTRTGRTLLFFPKYKIKVRDVQVTVTGAEDGDKVVLTFSGRAAKLKKKGPLSYVSVFPGRYKLEKQVINDLGIFSKSENLSIRGETSVTVDAEGWIQSDRSVREQLIRTVHQFNQEVSVWETALYNPKKLVSATNDFRNGESAVRFAEFNRIKSRVSEIQSAYLGMSVNMDSLSVTRYGGKWGAEVDAFVSYRYAYRLKKEKNLRDASYKRGLRFRLIYHPTGKKWLVSGLENTYDSEPTVSEWEKKEDVRVTDPKVMKWQVNGSGPQL